VNKQKRYEGRAIRKQRRETREAIAVLSSIDLKTISLQIAAAFESFCRTIEEAIKVGAQLEADFAAACEQEYRMTHRALTTGTPALSAIEHAEVGRFGIHDEDESEGVW
jgi:hypothetical protein